MSSRCLTPAGFAGLSRRFEIRRIHRGAQCAAPQAPHGIRTASLERNRFFDPLVIDAVEFLINVVLQCIPSLCMQRRNHTLNREHTGRFGDRSHGNGCIPVASHNSVMTLNIGVALGQFAEPGSPGPQLHRQWRCLPNVDRRGRNVFTPSPTGACSQSGHRDRSNDFMHDADRLWNARTTRMNMIGAMRSVGRNMLGNQVLHLRLHPFHSLYMYGSAVEASGAAGTRLTTNGTQARGGVCVVASHFDHGRCGAATE